MPAPYYLHRLTIEVELVTTTPACPPMQTAPIDAAIGEQLRHWTYRTHFALPVDPIALSRLPKETP